ncbi:MAG: type II secretion system F family protein [Candidatus Niyogibacteria bacterium]|nr:type II secretion system F family protein [Candidatus Niyogibacteria bacterium]
MLFYYKAKTREGEDKSGSIEAATQDLAVAALQRRELIIVSLEAAEERGSWLWRNLAAFERVKDRDIVILSRQMATLFGAKVAVVDALRILVTETTNEQIRKGLTAVADDIQGGLPISQAMARQPKIFTPFYTQMVRSGEESGKLEDVLNYLADYLERSYDLISKARNALIYPSFVVVTFAVVISIMLVVVVPRLSSILIESGQAVPLYTRIIIGLSDFLRVFGIFIILGLVIAGIVVWRYRETARGRRATARFQLSIPIVRDLYRQLYLARFADNLQTLLSGGVPVARSLEVASDVVGNEVYASILRETRDAVSAGSSISDALARYEDVPPLVSQMIKIGEETGKLVPILETLAKFYNREVNNTLERIVSLIEPALIVGLGLGVGIIVAAILVPIYNLSIGI